jgi:hypothetical protein
MSADIDTPFRNYPVVWLSGSIFYLPHLSHRHAGAECEA